MPTGQQFQEAIQNPHLNLGDPELRQGRPVVNQLGLPKPITGNFATVFTLTCDGAKRYAIKCFFNDFTDLRERYDAIHEYLESVEYPWEVGFEYLPRGIRVGGSWHPIVKMEWVDAVRLDRYIEQHLGQSNAILEIVDKFAQAVKTLNETGTAHGDLQHGNILVMKSGDLRLVDYDGMFVPALAGRRSHELGHPNYQHPSRSERDFGPYLDNFSAWVIYISLLAVAVDPTIWDRVGGGDDALIFKRQDFNGGIFSPGFGAIEATGNDGLQELAAQLRSAVSQDITKVPRLTPIKVEIAEPFPIAPGLPSWMSGGEPAEAPAASNASVGGLEWMISQLGQFPTIPVHFNVGVPRAVLLLAATAIGLAALLGATAVISVLYAVIPAVGALIVASGTCWGAYRRAPVVRAKKQALREVAAQRKLETVLTAAVRDLVKQRASNEEDHGRKTAEIQRDRDQIVRDEGQSLQKAEQRMQSRLREFAENRAALASDEQNERAKALAQLQQEFICAELGHYSISGSGLGGIGAALTARLAASGIRSAADFRGASISSGGYYSYPIAYLVLSNGRSVHVSGIGPTKARALENWRRGVENRLRARARQTLPPSQVQEIRQKYAAKLNQIGVDEQRARRTAQQEADEIRARSQQRQVKLRTELQNVRVAPMQRRTELDERLAQARKRLNSEQLAVARKDREADTYRYITFPRFLAAIVGL